MGVIAECGRDRAWQALCDAGRAGLTDFELAAITGTQQTSIGKRRHDLMREGLVEDSGIARMSPSGAMASVWRATPVERVPIADLRGAQIRQHLDQSLIAKYSEAMQRGEVFPPVEVFRDDDGALFLSDGFHRKHAALAAGATDIDARIRAGTEREALWFGIGANGKHGKRLNDGDIKHAILLALETWPDRSTTMIAEQVGCGQQYVARIKEQVTPSSNLPARVTGKDGKSYPAKHDKSQRAVAQRVDQVRQLATTGATVDQIAEAVGVKEQRVRQMCKTNDIAIVADRVMLRTKKIDSVRIIEAIVEAAEHLVSEAKYIDWDDVRKEDGRERVAEWVASLSASRKGLTKFMTALERM